MYFYKFAAAIILDIAGRDAPRYLNARLTNDVKSLAQGHALIAAALSPQGRTQGFFCVLRQADDRFLLVCDGGARETVLAALMKYKVADRVDVADLSATKELLHVVCPDDQLRNIFPALPTIAMSFSQHGDLFITRRERLGTSGFDIVAPASEMADLVQKFLNAGLRPLTAGEWTLLRLKHGAPSFPDELNEEALFAEAELQGVISFTKGCYTGQEVIEKIAAHGKKPRVLRRLRLPGQHEPADLASSPVSVTLNGATKNIGQIITAAYDSESGSTICFASIKDDPTLLDLEVSVQNVSGKVITP